MDQLVREIELMDKLTPQLRTILNHVRRVGYITPVEAWDHYRIRSLSRRMCDFKDLGFDVSTERRKHPVTEQTYTRYYIQPSNMQAAA